MQKKKWRRSIKLPPNVMTLLEELFGRKFDHFYVKNFGSPQRLNLCNSESGVGLIKLSLPAREVVSFSRDGAEKRIEKMQQFLDHKLAIL
jgi:hypothetical protein